MITVKNLHKKFKSFHALEGIDLRVRKGEIYGFIGHNGAGKSTTMNILTGLSRPTSGYCLVNGKDVSAIHHPSELHIGYLPEEPKFYPWMTAFETLKYLGNSNAHTVAKKRIDEMLGWVGLEDAANRRVGGFSRGMKQRLGIGTALIHDPELLILDEPSSALDPEGRSDVLRLIRDLKSMGKTVFFSTHILDDVERVCDTVGMLACGKIIMEKPLAKIQKDNIVPIYDVVLSKHCDQALIDHIKTIDGVTSVKAKKTKLSVTVKDVNTGSKEMMAFLSAQDVLVRSFTLRQNNLEDIFIAEVNNK